MLAGGGGGCLCAAVDLCNSDHGSSIIWSQWVKLDPLTAGLFSQTCARCTGPSSGLQLGLAKLMVREEGDKHRTWMLGGCGFVGQQQHHHCRSQG